jgi:hypothetical protein
MHRVLPSLRTQLRVLAVKAFLIKQESSELPPVWLSAPSGIKRADSPDDVLQQGAPWVGRSAYSALPSRKVHLAWAAHTVARTSFGSGAEGVGSCCSREAGKGGKRWIMMAEGARQAQGIQKKRE